MSINYVRDLTMTQEAKIIIDMNRDVLGLRKTRAYACRNAHSPSQGLIYRP